jgi:hypothetical protein
VALWEHFGQSVEEGMTERAGTSRAWREPFGVRVRSRADRVRGRVARRVPQG